MLQRLSGVFSEMFVLVLCRSASMAQTPYYAGNDL
jgi:hypothetical protein